MRLAPSLLMNETAGGLCVTVDQGAPLTSVKPLSWNAVEVPECLPKNVDSKVANLVAAVVVCAPVECTDHSMPLGPADENGKSDNALSLMPSKHR